jgi:alanine racemase
VEKLLRPALTWKTRVTQLKSVSASDTIGYGRTYKTTRDSRIAVLPVGYSDGYDRNLSNQSYVLIRSKHAPVRGRICMNLMMVDVTDIPGVELYDEVVLVGQQGDEAITADQLAAMCSTINYEIVSRINWEIPRVVVE